MQRDPKSGNVFLGHVTSVTSSQTVFDFPATAFLHFHIIIVCAQRNTQFIFILHKIFLN